MRFIYYDSRKKSKKRIYISHDVFATEVDFHVTSFERRAVNASLIANLSPFC